MRTLSLVLVLVACGGDTPVTSTTPPTGTTEPAPPEGQAWRLHEDFGSVAYVAWDQAVEEDVHIEVSVDEGEWLASPTKAATVGRNERIVLGIPYATTAQWRIVGSTSGIVDGIDPIVTGDPPQQLPLGTLVAEVPAEQYADGRYFLTSVSQQRGSWNGGPFWTFIMDRKGRPVWARSTPQQHWTIYVQEALSGDHILWEQATYWSSFGNGEDGQIHRQYLDVTAPFESIPAPGIHHAFVQLPDGTLTWGSKSYGAGEALVELAPGATSGTVVWTCADDWPGSGACESNCIWYSAERDTYLYSFYTNNSIVEVDRSDFSSRWWAGDVANGFDFDPPESEITWQHGVSWTDAGTLLISSDAFVSGEEVTMLREYTVDETKGVLTEIWNYNPGIIADTNGDALRLPNGNTMHVIGSGGQVREITPEGTVAWQVNFVDEGRFRLMGRGGYLDDLYALVSPDAR